MKICRWLFTLLLLLLIAGIYSPATADWVPVEDPLVITQSVPNLDGELIKVEVKITNNSDIDVEGTLRLTFAAKDDNAFSFPDNANKAGEEGSNLTPYFDIETLQKDLFEGEEITYVDMEFSTESVKTFFNADELTSDQIASLPTYYSLQIELNDESLLSEMFRKKISKNPEFYSGEGGIQVMPVYVMARDTKDKPYIRDGAGELLICCDDNVDPAEGECFDCSDTEEVYFARVKPLIVTYLEEEEDAPFDNVPCYDANDDGIADGGLRYAHDVYAAVSLDGGLTWKRKNISRTAAKSSFTMETCDGETLEYPGDSESRDMVVAGHYTLVTWVDKYCRSGNPWDLPDTEDIYQVTGTQKSVDYLDVTGDEDPRPDLGVRPFSCLWAARGVLELNPESPDYGTIIWYNAEQLSVGRRDAIRNFTAAMDPVYDGATAIDDTGGFAVVWQEDAKGLKTGKGRGPGAGMSGASVNHKTDVWYSYINWADFAEIDTEFVPTEGGDDADPSDDSDGNTEYYCPDCGYVYDPDLGVGEIGNENYIAPGTKFVDLPEGWVCPVDNVAKLDFIKDTKPHALNLMSSPVPLTDNAVCRDRTPEEVWGHIHDPLVTDCDYYYEGGTNNEPLYWDELPPTPENPESWVCPKCGLPKSTFLEDPELIKFRNEGGPYCDQFSGNPRVDGDGNYISPDIATYAVAYYTQDGEWQSSAGDPLGSAPGDATINEDGTATIGETRVYWSGEPLDGNTGASRPNLSLVNYNNQTLALMAYEETKGIGAGSDKQASAMEQKAPYPLVKVSNDSWEAGATNSDCRSCHYQNLVPRDRLIPMATPADCTAKGATWVQGLAAYYPYTGYPYITDAPVSDSELIAAGVSTLNPATGLERPVSCVKYFADKTIVARDLPKPDDGYNDLPDHMPGWHQEALDCTSCHLPYNTKDLDQDTVVDRADMCPGTLLPTDPPPDPLGDYLDLDPESPTYGCSTTQDPDDKDNNKDEPDRYRHGKNIYYHHFVFNPDPEIFDEIKAIAVSHGDQINLKNKFDWSEQGDIYENARRVRVVPNAAYDGDPDSVTLGLLYKEGKDGQGAPADAILRLFRGGFDVENMDTVPLNMSSSTPVWFQDPLDAGNEDGSSDNSSGDGTGDLIGNHKTPHIEYHYWTDENLNDPTGFWLENDSGDKTWEDDEYTPIIRANPFENVFSTRLAIYGNTLVSGFAHCVNWSAGKNAKDHYDFYIRVSKDKGKTWTLPINVSQLKNHEESVSDCRVILTPETTEQPYPAESGTPADISMNGAPTIASPGDFNNPNVLFVAVGTKENIPQPNPNEDETEENEVFLDLFYSKVTIEGTEGGENGDLTLLFETFSKENPKHETDCPLNDCLEYLDAFDGLETALAEHCVTPDNCIPNEPNPAYPEFIEEFDWLAKGDANQGDVQLCSNPQGTKIFTIWEQELPLLEDEDGQKHFQGADVWFRKMSYPDPEAAAEGDVDGDGDTDWEDGKLILSSIGSTAYDSDFLWTGDYVPDFRITGHDYNRWKVQFTKDTLKKQRRKWRSR